MRLIRFVVVVATLALSGPGAAPAYAQDARERTELALAVTDQRIELAARLVAEADHELARVSLAAAQDLQLRARNAFGAAQYPLAMRLTLDARARADHAISLVRGLPDPDRIAAQLERTREILDVARERMAECRIDRVHALLHAAVDMQHRAERAFDAPIPRFLAALQLTTGARERASRALRICRVEETQEVSAGTALRRTDAVIDRARERLAAGAPPPARDALARAIDLQAMAREQLAEERPEAALQTTRSARAFAHRALRITDRPPPPRRH